MPLSPPSWPGSGAADRAALLRAGLNILTEPWPLAVTATQNAIASGQTEAVAVGLRAGDVVTNMLASVTTAAVGAVPTLIRQGIANAAGTMLAVTADSKASAQWTSVGMASVPLSPALTIPADGLYYLCIIEVGAFGGTALQLRKLTNLSTLPALAGGSLVIGGQAGQTDLPTVGNPLTLTVAAGVSFWLGAN